MATYKLTYFEAMGRAETARMMFKAAGIEFEDHRLTFEEWPAIKKSVVHGMLPFLEVNGKVIIQTLAFNRYIAREAGFYGTNNWESSRIDSICETVCDYEYDIDRLWWPEDSDEVKASLKKRYVEEKIPRIYGILETLLKENNGGDQFFVGSKISLADFFVLTFIDVTVRCHFPDNYDPKDFPKLAALVERVKQVPKIKEWIEKRPKTQF